MGKRLTEPCPYCRCTGFLQMADEYQATYDRLKELKRETTGAELGRLMSVRPTAMNNRLRGLELKGYATSRVSGRRRFYKAK